MSKGRKIAVISCALAAALSALIDFMFSEPVHHTFIHVTPGIYVLTGLIGAGALVVFSKMIFGPLVRRHNEYYTKGEEKDADR